MRKRLNELFEEMISTGPPVSDNERAAVRFTYFMGALAVKRILMNTGMRLASEKLEDLFVLDELDQEITHFIKEEAPALLDQAAARGKDHRHVM